MKKISTVAKCGNEIFEEPKLTIGLDLGDRAIHYCILDEAGKVILEHSLPTTPKGIQQVFSRIPRSRIALETGTHSPWVSRQLTHEHHYHPTQAEIHTKTYVLPMGTKVPVRTEETIDSATAAKGRPMRLKSATMFSTPTATWSFPVVQTLRSSFDRLRRETAFMAPPTLCWICNRFRLGASNT